MAVVPLEMFTPSVNTAIIIAKKRQSSTTVIFQCEIVSNCLKYLDYG